MTSKDGKEHVVKTDIGELRAMISNEENLIGKKVAYEIRPEFIEVENIEKTCQNRSRGKLIRLYYFGSYVECVFALGEGKIEVKSVVPPEKAMNLKIDKEYSLGWRSHDVVLLEKPSVIEDLNVEEVIYGK